MISRKQIFLVVVILVSSVVNLISLFSRSTVTRCEKILRESQESFDNQYSKLQSLVVSNNVNFLKSQIDKTKITSLISQDSIRKTKSQLFESTEENKNNIHQLNYDYIICSGEVYIKFQNSYLSIGDYLPFGKIIDIKKNYITLENGDVVVRAGSPTLRQQSSGPASTNKKVSIL